MRNPSFGCYLVGKYGLRHPAIEDSIAPVYDDRQSLLKLPNGRRFVDLLLFGQYFYNCAFCHSDEFRVRFGIVWNDHQCLV